MCVGLLKQRKKKEKWCLFLQWAPSSQIGRGGGNMAFHCWMLCGQVIPTLVLCVWKPSLRFRLYSSPGRSSHKHATTSATTHERSSGPFCIPAPSTGHEVVSVHPWLSISSLDSLQLFISGGCSPLYFYFYLSSKQWYEINSPTVPPSCPSITLFFYNPIIFSILP